jgi:hypothetical protein
MTNNTNTPKPTARNILAAMRAAAAAIDPTVAYARVTETRQGKRRQYMLEVTDAKGKTPMWDGAPVRYMIEEDGSRTLWVRPRYKESDRMSSARSLDPAQDSLDILRSIQATYGEALPYYAATPAHRVFVVSPA